MSQAAAKRPKHGPKDPPSGASTPKTPSTLGPKETPVPAAAVEAQMPPAGSVVAEAPPVPVLPTAAEATNYSEEKTETLM